MFPSLLFGIFMANYDILVAEVEKLLAPQLDTIVNGLVKMIKKKIVEKLTPVLTDRVKRGLVEESARALNASACSKLTDPIRIAPAVVKSSPPSPRDSSSKRLCVMKEPVSEPMMKRRPTGLTILISSFTMVPS